MKDLLRIFMKGFIFCAWFILSILLCVNYPSVGVAILAMLAVFIIGIFIDKM